LIEIDVLRHNSHSSILGTIFEEIGDFDLDRKTLIHNFMNFINGPSVESNHTLG
jgi:hypothetical protein